MPRFQAGFHNAVSWGPSYIYINDLPLVIQSFKKLFADDTKVYQTVSTLAEVAQFQNSRTWQEFGRCSTTTKMLTYAPRISQFGPSLLDESR